MEVTLKQINPTNASLTISIVAEDFEANVASKLKEHAKKAQIKGFRPGKVPPSLIKNMMGESIIAEEVFGLVNQGISNYIKDNKLSIIGDPLPAEEEKNKVVDWKNDTSFEFSYNLGTIPAFDISFDKMKLTKYEVEIEDKTIDETIDGLKQQYAKTVNPETVDAEDYVSGSIKEIDGEIASEKSMIPMNKVAKTEGKKLTGKKVGDTVTFNLKKLFKGDVTAMSHVAGISKEEAENVDSDFEFTISAISRTEDATLDQEFFNKVLGEGKVASEEEFKAELAKNLEENYNKDADFLLSKEIKDQLVETNAIDYSSEFFKRWLLETNRGSLTAEDLDSKYSNYETELKWTFLRNKIAEDNNVEVKAEDVKAKASDILRYQMLGGMEITPELQERFNAVVDNYLKEENGKNYYQAFDQVMNDKIFAKIKEQVSPAAKKVKSEAFKTIAEEATKA